MINQEGNLYDTSALAATAALLNAKLPKVEVKDGEVKLLDEKIPVPIRDISLQTTYAKFGDHIMVDPSIIEEGCMDARLTVAIDKSGNVVSLQKGGNAPFTIDEVNSCIERAIKHGKTLKKSLSYKE